MESGDRLSQEARTSDRTGRSTSLKEQQGSSLAVEPGCPDASVLGHGFIWEGAKCQLALARHFGDREWVAV